MNAGASLAAELRLTHRVVGRFEIDRPIKAGGGLCRCRVGIRTVRFRGARRRTMAIAATWRRSASGGRWLPALVSTPPCFGIIKRPILHDAIEHCCQVPRSLRAFCPALLKASQNRVL